MNVGLGQPKPRLKPVVAFDFDGTLTCRDSFLAFLTWRAGAGRLLAGLPRLGVAALSYGLTRDRGAFKATVARQLLGDIERDALETQARQFAADQFEILIRPDALNCWREWGARGATRLIVTASPDILVAPFAEMLGAEGLIGTRLKFDERGRLTGRLDGLNCRGPQKVARLREFLGGEFRLDAAYGDTSGDREMLDVADAPGFRVFTERISSSQRRRAQ